MNNNDLLRDFAEKLLRHLDFLESPEQNIYNQTLCEHWEQATWRNIQSEDRDNPQRIKRLQICVDVDKGSREGCVVRVYDELYFREDGGNGSDERDKLNE